MKTEDISTLSGMELRKALIGVLGWKFFNYESGMYATTEEDITNALNNDGYTLEDWSDHREAWEFQPESDATLSEELLDRVCRDNKWEWRVSMQPQRGGYSCDIYATATGGPYVIDRADGATPSEARGRAIVMALQKGR